METMKAWKDAPHLKADEQWGQQCPLCSWSFPCIDFPYHQAAVSRGSVSICVNDRCCFWVAAFNHNLIAAVGAVGTVEKRSLFFHGFHSPVLCLRFHFVVDRALS
jgi:hypothetical protein